MKYNPFNPNSVVSTNLFAGRKRYIFQMIRKLEQVKMGMPSSFFLFGERGIGKTALAKLLKHIAESKDTMFGNLNFLTSYYTAEKGQTIGSVLQSSLNELTDRLPKTALEVLSTKLGAVFKNGKFSIGPFSLEMASQPTPEVVTILKDQIVSILSNIFISLKSSENQTNEKDGVLIIIDEMQNVSDLSLCAQLLRGIITTLDVKEMGLISFLLIGYDDAAFFEGDLSARRQFDTICLEVMSLEEAGEAMTKGFQAAGVGHDEHELRKNIIATGGYPHAIQLLAHNLL
ncbi:MAG TPA: ATP-binding protein, partial [bacterium]|nr:ATP-binding protein [bacterium]